jgi:biotin carboxyl carrier protein
MNPQEIKDFLKSIKDTDIEEMQYNSGDNSLYFKKSCVESIIPILKEIPVEKKEEKKKQTIIPIKSKMVGTFAGVQSNDKEPLLKEGDNIAEGQKIGQIEAMKIIKDIHSDIKGKIVKILIANGQPVEYGQELFLVDVGK